MPLREPPHVAGRCADQVLYHLVGIRLTRASVESAKVTALPVELSGTETPPSELLKTTALGGRGSPGYQLPKTICFQGRPRRCHPQAGGIILLPSRQVTSSCNRCRPPTCLHRSGQHEQLGPDSTTVRRQAIITLTALWPITSTMDRAAQFNPYPRPAQNRGRDRRRYDGILALGTNDRDLSVAKTLAYRPKLIVVEPLRS